MNRSRRKFIQQCAAVVGTSAMTHPFSQPLSAAPDQALTNWAGNLQYSTAQLHSANTIRDVQDFVRQQARLKVLGTRHCFNRIADSSDVFLSMREMNQIVSLDAKARTVTIEAGMSYGQLCPLLDQRGFALHNLASLPHISVAGACATATHGSGVTNGNLATAVSGLEIVTATGDVVTVSRARDGAGFQGAVVHLGALGVVTKVTLDIQPTYTMRQHVYLNMPMAQVKDHFDAIVSAGYSVSLFTNWQGGKIDEVWVKSRVGHDGAKDDAPEEFYGARAATADVHPIVELSAENCTEQRGVVGPWYERLPHFRMGFTPSSGKELQSEYFVPRAHAVDAILAVERLRDQVSPHLFISELRTIDADELWMSTAYKRPSLAIHFTWKQDWESVSKVLPVIEGELAPYDVRPHWGKLFTIPAADLRKRYERFDDFKQLAAQYDPKGKFRNDFLNRSVFA
jgi:alditol oxidase